MGEGRQEEISRNVMSESKGGLLVKRGAKQDVLLPAKLFLTITLMLFLIFKNPRILASMTSALNGFFALVG